MGARRIDQPGDFLDILAAIAQQHQEGAELDFLDPAGQHHGERPPRLGARQRARAAGAATESRDKAGKFLAICGGDGHALSCIGNQGPEALAVAAAMAILARSAGCSSAA
jgi:hypothetical protein